MCDVLYVVMLLIKYAQTYCSYILASYEKGTTIIKDASELKVKESNRIDTVVQSLINMDADVIATDDGMIIHGGRPLHGTQISTKLDHRIAMSFTIAGLFADGETTLDNFSCVDISFPNFFELLNI